MINGQFGFVGFLLSVGEEFIGQANADLGFMRFGSWSGWLDFEFEEIVVLFSFWRGEGI